MSKNIIINSKDYKLKEIDFNAVCELGKLGLRITDKDCLNDTFNVIRSSFAFHSGLQLDLAGKELEEHLMNGGSFDDFTPLIETLGNSDFFTMLAKNSK